VIITDIDTIQAGVFLDFAVRFDLAIVDVADGEVIFRH